MRLVVEFKIAVRGDKLEEGLTALIIVANEMIRCNGCEYASSGKKSESMKDVIDVCSFGPYTENGGFIRIRAKRRSV